MRYLISLGSVLVLVACGHPARPAGPVGGGGGSGSGAAGAGSEVAGSGSGSAEKKVVGHNETCFSREGERGGGKEVADCADGLECCYPCGIPGCDSVCMTHEECEESITRP
ncbi:MAG TPA: hypothetical protein VHE35_21830 [Kofleriaceae bacterium]|nr:hypothetical protein [Kofleriaceae bacterium]